MNMNTIRELQKSLVNVKREIVKLSSEKLCFPEELFDEKIVDNKKTDILSPIIPLVTYKKDEKYIIIDGCKRYSICHPVNVEWQCIALKLEEMAETTSVKKFAGLIRILVNCSRNVEILEKVLFIRWLKANVNNELYGEFCSLLGINNKERYELERLCECDFSVLLAVKNKILDSAVAYEINRMNISDRDAIISFFKNYLFSKQMQRELVDLVSELAFRKACSIKDVLTLEPIKEIEKNTKLNNPQKIEKIKNALFELRYPNVAKSKKVWKEKASKINPCPSKIHFKPSDSFEKDLLEIQLHISSAKEAKDIFAKLSSISEEMWHEIVCPF